MLDKIIDYSVRMGNFDGTMYEEYDGTYSLMFPFGTKSFVFHGGTREEAITRAKLNLQNYIDAQYS